MPPRRPSSRARSCSRAPIRACFPSTTTTLGRAIRRSCGTSRSWRTACAPSRKERRMAEMDIQAVLEHLPQRYPFLMIDRVKELEPGKRIVAVKNVSANEPHFVGHFPGRPIMPGVLILEAMAQAAGLLVFRTEGTKPDANSVYYYVGIDNARFKKPVVPGDVLEIEVSLDRFMRGIGKFTCAARVDGQVVAEASILCAMKPKDA